MQSTVSSSLQGADSPLAWNVRGHLAGSALLFFGRSQETAAWTISSHTPADALVLNLGGTNSRFVRQLKARQQAARIVRLDHLGARGEWQTLPYRAATFDAVLSLFSLHCWRQAPEALLEMARVLRPGGILIISELTAEDLAAYPGGAKYIARRMFENSPSVVDFYRWLDNAGLRVLEAQSTLSGRHGLLLSAEKGSRRMPSVRLTFHDSGKQG